MVGAHGHRTCQGVQHELAVGEVDPLGVAGGPGGVKGRGPGVLVQVREGVIGVRGPQEFFIVGVQGERGLGFPAVLGDENHGLDGCEFVPDALQQRQEGGVDDDRLGLGVVDGVNDLLGRKPPVHGLEGGAHAGDAEKAFEVAVAVEVEHRHHVAGLYSQAGQSVRQPVNSLMQRAVGAAVLVAVDDFLVGGV